MKPILRLLAILALATVSHAQTAPRTVIVFGDSLTEGSALPKEQRDRVWVRLVENQSGGALQMINEGKGGRPTASLGEFKAMLARHPRTDALIIALGGNDARDITTNCVPNALANLRQMITLARKTYGDTLPLLLVGPLNIRKESLGPSKPIANERDANLRALGPAFAKLAAETRCAYTSLYGVAPATTLTHDGVHPDLPGNEAMAKFLLPTIRKLALAK